MNAEKIIICFGLCIIVWLGGLIWFVCQIPVQPITDSRTADAIVVLTGGNGRIEYGLELLAEGKGKDLFISGVSTGITTEQLLQEEPVDIRTRLTSSEVQHIALGHQARNTIGNATETARWLKARDYKSIQLVTANYHMPRSIDEFREVAPGIAIIPAPVFSDNFRLEGWWNNPDSRMIMLSEYDKYLAGEARHWVVSFTRRP